MLRFVDLCLLNIISSKTKLNAVVHSYFIYVLSFYQGVASGHVLKLSQSFYELRNGTFAEKSQSIARGMYHWCIHSFQDFFVNITNYFSFCIFHSTDLLYTGYKVADAGDVYIKSPKPWLQGPPPAVSNSTDHSYTTQAHTTTTSPMDTNLTTNATNQERKQVNIPVIFLMYFTVAKHANAITWYLISHEQLIFFHGCFIYGLWAHCKMPDRLIFPGLIKTKKPFM